MNYIKYLVLLLFFFASLHASLTSKSAIFYYGDDTPYSLLGIHDYIILKPESANEFTHGFKIYKDNIYAQIDIATLDLKGSYSADFDKQWILSNSVIQDSELLDMSNQDYHLFIYNNIINPLIEQGYKNFYFDHLNVYQASTIRDEKQALIEEGIIKFLYEFNHRYPDAKIILNAESKIIAKVHDFIEALVYESLFKGLSSNGFNYVDVSNLNRELLLSEISKVQKYNKPIIILDYLPFSKRALMTETLKKIEAFNFIPYIGNRTLSAVGQSSKNALKREVLFLYDGTFENKDIDETSAFQQGALPIEYLGYIPILYDVSKKILSDDILQRYAGVVVWLNGEYTRKEPKAFIRWVHALRKNDLKILFFEGLDSDYHLSIFKTLDIDIEKDVIDNTKKKIISDSEYIGYEVDPFFPSLDTYFHPKNSQVLCQVKTEENYSVMAAITPWGGYAFEGSMLIEMAGNTLWIANPFKLFQEALRLQPLAVPDFTTDNGKRLLFIHMDGDGIMNAAEWDAELFSGD
ncbi:MAG: endo alpha-1,4 polygalactosaminidase, partial [Campylobacterota bacterium]|nr:endo alpha-1,4 polygalactosaminidase [Campylobacterota bacterium]